MLKPRNSSSFVNVDMAVQKRGRSRVRSSSKAVAKRVRYRTPSGRKMPISPPRTPRRARSAPPAYRSVRGRNYSPVLGTYGGKIKMHKKKSWKEKFNRKGVVSKTEIVADVEDDNAVYAFCDVIRPLDAITYAVAAALRLLFEKAGLRLTGMDESMITLNQGSATVDEYIVLLNGFNAVTGAAITPVAYTTTSTSTFKDCVSSFIETVRDYIIGYGEADPDNTVQLTRFDLYKVSVKADGATATQIVLSTVMLDELQIEYYGECEMNFQNRTQSATGSTLTDDIGANAIVGRSYEFKGMPRFKNYSYKIGGSVINTQPFLSLGNVQGLGVSGGTSSTVCNELRTVPEPGLFWNCVKNKKVRLEPGQVKTIKGNFSKTESWIGFLQKMKYQTAYSYYSYNRFPCLMVAFEDVINLNATYKVKVTVGVDRYFGAKCSEKKRKWMKSDFEKLVMP